MDSHKNVMEIGYPCRDDTQDYVSVFKKSPSLREGNGRGHIV